MPSSAPRSTDRGASPSVRRAAPRHAEGPGSPRPLGDPASLLRAPSCAPSVGSSEGRFRPGSRSRPPPRERRQQPRPSARRPGSSRGVLVGPARQPHRRRRRDRRPRCPRRGYPRSGRRRSPWSTRFPGRWRERSSRLPRPSRRSRGRRSLARATIGGWTCARAIRLSNMCERTAARYGSGSTCSDVVRARSAASAPPVRHLQDVEGGRHGASNRCSSAT
jgi:hypothetical protein